MQAITQDSEAIKIETATTYSYSPLVSKLNKYFRNLLRAPRLFSAVILFEKSNLQWFAFYEDWGKYNLIFKGRQKLTQSNFSHDFLDNHIHGKPQNGSQLYSYQFFFFDTIYCIIFSPLGNKEKLVSCNSNIANVFASKTQRLHVNCQGNSLRRGRAERKKKTFMYIVSQGNGSIRNVSRLTHLLTFYPRLSFLFTKRVYYSHGHWERVDKMNKKSKRLGSLSSLPDRSWHTLCTRLWVHSTAFAPTFRLLRW